MRTLPATPAALLDTRASHRQARPGGGAHSTRASRQARSGQPPPSPGTDNKKEGRSIVTSPPGWYDNAPTLSRRGCAARKTAGALPPSRLPARSALNGRHWRPAPPTSFLKKGCYVPVGRCPTADRAGRREDQKLFVLLSRPWRGHRRSSFSMRAWQPGVSVP